MHSKILIVEDQFIEANDLRIILEKEGHSVCGIAKSVDQAINILRKERPEIVLLDIFLKGDLTGIHFAKILMNENIPFIYLSANSNPSTLEAAKATRPYGFLVKPFREKDILVALDIASYRHKHALELMSRQERWISDLLNSIINDVATQEQKLLLLAKAFKPFIHFDIIIIDTNIASDDIKSVYGFRRVDFDEYKSMDSAEFLQKARITSLELNKFRKENIHKKNIEIHNGLDFDTLCTKNKVPEKLKTMYDVQSSLWVPIVAERNICMSIAFYNVRPDYFDAGQVELLTPLRSLLATILENIRKQKTKAPALSAGEKEPHKGWELQPGSLGIVGKSPKLLHVLDQVMQVAPFETSVLILGETGVGKEGLANAIHQLSGRSQKPLIKINCAAIPGSLIESELFGHEKGAFTGALERRIGKFEQAQGGTIFLDEIGEIPLVTQSKLLRVLQEKELERIGGRGTIKMDVRIIAATNRNLHKEVAMGRFRMDLYYRINVFPINVPPLRERKEDIPLLANHFLQQNACLSGNTAKKITPEAIQKLMGYSWPGNIRELQHLIERHILTTSSMLISGVELPEEDIFGAGEYLDSEEFKSIADVNKAHIVAALKKCNGKVSGNGGAADILGIPPNTLTSKMKKLGIVWKYIYK
jgi:transcriptional regulator with GAF, ATPase, and Fis domain